MPTNQYTTKYFFVNCGFCRALLKRAEKRFLQSRYHFCNRQCKNEWQKTAFAGNLNPSFTNAKIKVQCFTCEKTFLIAPAKKRRNKACFCSPVCYADYRVGRFDGANSASWKGGNDGRKRGRNWKTQRKKALERDKNICRLCFGNHYLQVHHIKPFAFFGWIKGENENYLEANALANLITLCASCHHKTEHGKISII